MRLKIPNTTTNASMAVGKGADRCLKCQKVPRATHNSLLPCYPRSVELGPDSMRQLESLSNLKKYVFDMSMSHRMMRPT
jgi:hypothetical protein